MIRLLLSLFLMLNSLAGFFFYEGTSFGDYLYSLDYYGQLLFFLINFVLSHVLIILLNTPLGIISLSLLILLAGLFLLAFGIWLPYWIIYVLIEASAESVFAGVIFIVLLATVPSIVLGPILRLLIDLLSGLIISFFDNLRDGAINNAIKNSKRLK
jgi:hypothetical protein